MVRMHVSHNAQALVTPLSQTAQDGQSVLLRGVNLSPRAGWPMVRRGSSVEGHANCAARAARSATATKERNIFGDVEHAAV